MSEMCDRGFCVCANHIEYQTRANERLKKAIEEETVIPENNFISSVIYLECTFGPTKDGFMVKDLMASVDNDLLCKQQSTQFCDCDTTNRWSLVRGKMMRENTDEEWAG